MISVYFREGIDDINPDFFIHSLLSIRMLDKYSDVLFLIEN